MSIELVYAATHISGNFSNPSNALGNTPSTWAGTINDGKFEESIYRLVAPSGQLTGLQTVRAIFRRGGNNNIPDGRVCLVDDTGALLTPDNRVPINSTVGQTVLITFDASLITDLNDIRMMVTSWGPGGGPNARNSAQVSHIELEAQLDGATVDPGPSFPWSGLASERLWHGLGDDIFYGVTN